MGCCASAAIVVRDSAELNILLSKIYRAIATPLTPEMADELYGYTTFSEVNDYPGCMLSLSLSPPGGCFAIHKPADILLQANTGWTVTGPPHEAVQLL
jgi:hypothetical protein